MTKFDFWEEWKWAKVTEGQRTGQEAAAATCTRGMGLGGQNKAPVAVTLLAEGALQMSLGQKDLEMGRLSVGCS